MNHAKPTSERQQVLPVDDGVAGPGNVSDHTVPRLRVDGLSKQFRRVKGDRVLAVDDVTLEVYPGEFLVLLGPSGCGKTTLLRCIAGLEVPDQGEISLDGELLFSSVKGVSCPPERRNMSMLFQSYALWPHMTVYENVAYPLRTARVARSEIDKSVTSILERMECAHLANQHPGQISGGQQQRIALARALVADNKVILFDEPLSNVDAKVREKLRIELIELQRQFGFSAIYVTHDQTEALGLADRVGVLETGRFAQIDTPRMIYERPVSRYVAAFVGKVNEIVGTRSDEKADGGFNVRTDAGTIKAGQVDRSDLMRSEHIVVSWRPEASRLEQSPPADALPNSWEGTVVAALYLGPLVEYVIRVDGMLLRSVQSSQETTYAEGDEVWVTVDAKQIMAFPLDAGEETLGEDRRGDESL